MATQIQYDNISEAKFTEFLEALKNADKEAYEEEGQDGFVDLYNYWNKISYERHGMVRFEEKILKNKLK